MHVSCDCMADVESNCLMLGGDWEMLIGNEDKYVYRLEINKQISGWYTEEWERNILIKEMKSLDPTRPIMMASI